MTLCYARDQTHSEFWHIQNFVYSDIFRYIQAYSAGRIQAYSRMLRHCYSIFTLIHAFSEPWVTLAYSQLLKIPIPDMFGTEGIQNLVKLWPEIFRTLPYTKHFIQTLFNHIQAYSEPCVTLAYAETWHIRNLGIFRTLPLLNPDNIQNSVIFTKIGKHCLTLEIQSPDII